MEKQTDKATTFEVPKHLRPSTRRWIQGVFNEYGFFEHHARLLILAGQAWDDAEAAREALTEHGMTYNDRFGSPRARPEVAILRDARLAFARILKQLNPPGICEPGDIDLDGILKGI